METAARYTASAAGLPAITEKQFMQQVIDLARLCGWLVYHPFDSRRSAAGFPDLVMVRGQIVIFAELKTERGRLSTAQANWLDRLIGARGTGVFCWRPSDWPEIERVLTARQW